MSVVNKIDARFATCRVKKGDEWVAGRYQRTRKSDGFHIVEVRSGEVSKTRKAFPPSDVELYDTTKVVVK